MVDSVKEKTSKKFISSEQKTNMSNNLHTCLHTASVTLSPAHRWMPLASHHGMCALMGGAVGLSPPPAPSPNGGRLWAEECQAWCRANRQPRKHHLQPMALGDMWTLAQGWIWGHVPT